MKWCHFMRSCIEISNIYDSMSLAELTHKLFSCVIFKILSWLCMRSFAQNGNSEGFKG